MVPRRHVATLRDLDASLRDDLFAQVQEVAAAVQDALGADGTFVAANNVVSQSVPHLHVHVVPRRFKDGLRGLLLAPHEVRVGRGGGRGRGAIRAALDRALHCGATM